MASKYLVEFKEANARAKEYRKATLAWAATPAIRTILENCEYLAKKYDLYEYGSISEGYVYLNLRTSQLDGLKDERLAELLSALLHSNPTQTRDETYAVSLNRDYIFEWTESTLSGHFRLIIRVAAYFKEDSETCKKVIVGYTEPSTEPKPIYELRCADDEDTPAAPAAPAETNEVPQE